LGHASKFAAMSTAKYYSWNTKNEFKFCENYGLAKCQQKNLDKEKNPRSMIKGECLFLDITLMDN